MAANRLKGSSRPPSAGFYDMKLGISYGQGTTPDHDSDLSPFFEEMQIIINSPLAGAGCEIADRCPEEEPKPVAAAG
jgi:hypothetical protein